MSPQQEQAQAYGKEGDELSMRRGHAIALAVHLAWALLLYVAFETPVDGLAGELAGEQEGDFSFTGAPEQRGVDDAETLGNEGEPCTEVGEAIGRILWV